MGNELKLNSVEEVEVILIRLTPEEYPIAYTNKVKCLMLSGLSEEEAKKLAEAYMQDASLDTTDYLEIVQDVLEVAEYEIIDVE